MLNQIEAKFKEWSPATFLGYSSINFDDEVLRKEFFKTLILCGNFFINRLIDLGIKQVL